MNNKTFRRAMILVTTFEGFFALVFGILFVVAVVSVAKGAWWHIMTACITFFICYALMADIKRILVKDKDNT